MKEIVCDFIFDYTPDHERPSIDHINQWLVRSGFTDVRLVEKKRKQVADLSFVDSVFNLTKAQGIVVFLSGELSIRNPRLMDYSILLTESSSPRHYQTRRVISRYKDPLLLKLSKRQARKTRFCSFIHDKDVSHRSAFVQKLQKYKQVDCPGACLNNMEPVGPSREEKIEFISRSRFTIAIENTAYPGYLTEKIFDALEAGSVPIYYGDPHAARYVNPKAFIDLRDFPTMEAAIDYILKVDKDPALYESYQKAEPFPENSTLYDDSEENLTLFYKTIFDSVGKSGFINSRFVRFYRFLYRFLYRELFKANYCISTLSMPDGISLAPQGAPMYKLLLHRRVWLHGLPHIFLAWFRKRFL